MNHTLPHSSFSEDAAVLAEIYSKDINISAWKRDLTVAQQNAAQMILSRETDLRVFEVVSKSDAKERICAVLGKTNEVDVIGDDVASLVDMFSYLFDVEQVGLRMRILDKPMCPRFHVDRVLCRLVTTYSGSATQWLHHDADLYKLLSNANNRHEEFEELLNESGNSI